MPELQVLQGGAEAAATDSDPMVGQLLGGKFRVQKKLGEGGQAQVYLVLHTGLEKQYAMKLPPRHQSINPDAVARFRQEAKVLAATRVAEDGCEHCRGARTEDTLSLDGLEEARILARRAVRRPSGGSAFGRL